MQFPFHGCINMGKLTAVLSTYNT